MELRMLWPWRQHVNKEGIRAIALCDNQQGGALPVSHFLFRQVNKLVNCACWNAIVDLKPRLAAVYCGQYPMFVLEVASLLLEEKK